MTTNNTNLTANETKGNRNPLVVIGGLIVLIGAAIVLLIGGTLFSSNSGETPETTVAEQLPASAVQLPEGGDPLQVGDQPYEFVLNDLNGNPVALSQFIGRPIIVNIWATWCGPCRIEMPELQAVFEEYKDDGLLILALDQDETAPDVQEYFTELGLTFDPLLDEGSQTARNYGLQGTLPATIFVNPEGEVTVVHRGVMTRGQIDTFLAETIPGKTVAG